MDFTPPLYRFYFSFFPLKTFTGFTSNIFMVASLLTPSRLIWWCILYNVITEGKTRLIRYSVWSSLVALMCIFQFSILPVESNKTLLSSSSACTPCFTLLCYCRLTRTLPVLFLTGMSLWSFQSYEYLRHSYKLLCWLKLLDHILFWLFQMCRQTIESAIQGCCSYFILMLQVQTKCQDD